jgi:uncharacterized protein (TIGR03435 family)
VQQTELQREFKAHGTLKSQLGLELNPTHAPIDILVIDHVERPSEN